MTRVGSQRELSGACRRVGSSFSSPVSGVTSRHQPPTLSWGLTLSYAPGRRSSDYIPVSGTSSRPPAVPLGTLSEAALTRCRGRCRSPGDSHAVARRGWGGDCWKARQNQKEQKPSASCGPHWDSAFENQILEAFIRQLKFECAVKEPYKES